MTKAKTPKTAKSTKVTFASLRDAAEAKIGKQELFARFNMYLAAIGRKPVAASTIQRYHSGYKNLPEGTNPHYSAFLKAIK